MIQIMTTSSDVNGPVQSGRMSDYLVRVGNLKALQLANGWDDSELGRQCGRSPQQVYAWFNGGRKIGEKLARSLEDQLNLSPYSLDDRAQSPRIGGATPDRGSDAGLALSVTKRPREMPVISWAQIGTMLEVENSVLQSRAPHLESYAAGSSKSKFLRMPDDSMAPVFAAGDHVLFDPTEAPRAGDVVLVRISTNEHFVRVFRPRTAHTFEALSLNENYQPLTSADDGAQVIAVMVEHRRYRRSL